MAYPLGSLCITDDTDPLPAVVFEPVAGATLGTATLPACEHAAVLPNGYIGLIPRADDTTVAIYDSNQAFVASVTIPDGGSARAIREHANNKWFVSTTDNLVVEVFPDGTLGTVWDLSTVAVGQRVGNICVSPDESILYWVSAGPFDPGGGTGTIARYDLINSVALSDLITDDPDVFFARGSGKYDMACLADGSVVIHCIGTITGDDIRRYSAAGALLNTYHLIDSGALDWQMDRWTLDVPQTHLWVWFLPIVHGASQFQEITIASGAVVVSFTKPTNYVSGVDVDPDGIPDSCPLLVFRVSSGGGGSGTNKLLKADTNADDDGETYQAYVKTRAIPPTGDITRYGEIQEPFITARASVATLQVVTDRDCGVERQEATISLAASGSEDHVVRKSEGSAMADMSLAQFQLGDALVSSQQWSLDELYVPVIPEGDR